RRRREALDKGDVSGLLDLAKWCSGVGLKAEEKTVLKQILVADTNHEAARRLLGYVRNESGKWVLEEELRKQKEKADEQENLRRGLVKTKTGEWVTKEEKGFLDAGKVRRDGEWLSKEDAEKLDKGGKLVDGEVISAEEAPQIEKGLFRVEGKWVTKQEANRLRSDWENAWRIPKGPILLRTNVDRDRAEGLLPWAEAGYRRLKDVLSTDAKPRSILLFGFKDRSEYNRYAQQLGDHHSSVYDCYFASADEERPGAFIAGDKDRAPFSIVHVVGHVYLDRLLRTSDPKEEEVGIPPWLDEGLASYIEFFHKDLPKETRAWVIGERIAKRGGLASVKQLITYFENPSGDREPSQRMMVEAGLLIAHYVDTKDERDRKLFSDLVKAIGGGHRKEVVKAAGALVQDAAGLEKKLQEIAGLK
ncbi:MAG TPA: hypothetical protein VKF62_12660, partial [Planctomycetota bacterium]|nr:hypothetical protein [Planctomycetota bacterium]